MVSTASRVGTGNIAGISTAICLGGAGAVFWMWLTALLGSASAFIESTLAQIYKHRAEDGSSYGGPAYYIQAALKKHWIGVLFAVILILHLHGRIQPGGLLQHRRFLPGLQTSLIPSHALRCIVGRDPALCLRVCASSAAASRSPRSQSVLVPLMGIFYLAGITLSS